MKSILFTSYLVVNFLGFVRCCNEAICGSIVSKCLLVRSCNCDMSTTKCIKDCHICLGSLYVDCCSCVDICPETSEQAILLKSNSQIGDFEEPVPELFRVLTEFPDDANQWSSETFPVNITKGLDEPITFTENCTVAFFHQCTNAKKCRDICQSLGSSSYRWFHDGCCECIGSTCINYGLKENKCKHCPEDDTELLYDDELDYGEGGPEEFD